MTFNSYFYFFFLLVLFALYFLLRKRVKAQNFLLLLASYFFYACWDWRFLSLILISTITDFIVARAIDRTNSPGKKKLWLIASIGANLGLLGFFKYFNFFISSAEELLTRIGVNADFPTLYIILPVGISFYTFQTLSYTIDVYRGDAKPNRSLLDFSLYVSFFPQLVAGPIERPNHLLPQIANPRILSVNNLVEGMHHILLGLFKKVVLADNMAIIVDGMFAPEANGLNGVENWLALVAFALQIYGDFSGYSSIAQGSAKLFGFDLSYNFHTPYFACSPNDFWRRWHVTLSRWLRDYVYIPLGGNRLGDFKTYRNLMLTMLLGGLWHGAGWHFVMWGCYHGILLAIYKMVPFLGLQQQYGSVFATVRHTFSVLVMFVLTLLGWLLFRIDNVPQILAITTSLVTDWEFTPLCAYLVGMIVFLALPLTIYEFVIYRNNDDHLLLLRKHWIYRAVLYNYFLIMILLFSVESAHEFIYFQF